MASTGIGTARAEGKPEGGEEEETTGDRSREESTVKKKRSFRRQLKEPLRRGGGGSNQSLLVIFCVSFFLLSGSLFFFLRALKKSSGRRLLASGRREVYFSAALFPLCEIFIAKESPTMGSKHLVAQPPLPETSCGLSLLSLGWIEEEERESHKPGHLSACLCSFPLFSGRKGSSLHAASQTSPSLPPSSQTCREIVSVQVRVTWCFRLLFSSSSSPSCLLVPSIFLALFLCVFFVLLAKLVVGWRA